VIDGIIGGKAAVLTRGGSLLLHRRRKNRDKKEIGWEYWEVWCSDNRDWTLHKERETRERSTGEKRRIAC